MVVIKELKGKVVVAFSIGIVLLVGAVVILSISGPFARPEKNIKWGITFSKLQAMRLGLDWRQAYTEILDGLGVKYLRLSLDWDEVETARDTFNFSAYDWMLEYAHERRIRTVLVVGRRTPRWPECHIPQWAVSLDKTVQDQSLREYIETAIKHFKDDQTIVAWQVENEPFLTFFGDCKAMDPAFLKQEADLVKSIDASRPIIITDSGELGDWVRSARSADILGTTMYRRVSSPLNDGGYVVYPLPPQFYRWKANFIGHFVPIHKLIVSELQGEPWVIGTSTASDRPLQEQYRTMNPEYFKEIIQYAKNSGIGEFYWWGAEWWLWLKQQGHPEIWNTAQELFRSNQ